MHVQVFCNPQLTTHNSELPPASRPPRQKRLQDVHGLRRRSQQVPDRLSHGPSTRLSLHSLDRQLRLQFPKFRFRSLLTRRGRFTAGPGAAERSVWEVPPLSEVEFSIPLAPTLCVGAVSPTLRVVCPAPRPRPSSTVAGKSSLQLTTDD